MVEVCIAPLACARRDAPHDGRMCLPTHCSAQSINMGGAITHACVSKLIMILKRILANKAMLKKKWSCSGLFLVAGLPVQHRHLC